MRAFGKIAVTLSLLMAVPAAAAGPELKSEDQKTVYALGLSIAQSLGSFALTAGEIELVSAGLRDGLANTPKVDVVQYSPQVKQLAQNGPRRPPKSKRRNPSLSREDRQEKGAEKQPQV